MDTRPNSTVLRPKIHPSVFIAEGARIYGDVEIGEGSSIWFNAVIRGDEGAVKIGRHTNIQDNVVLHSDDGAVTIIGDHVTVGHGAVVRGCRIGNHVMIGMNATIMSHSVIGDEVIVGANALVPYRTKVEKGSLSAGVPSKGLRKLSADECRYMEKAVEIYADLIKKYKSGQILGHQPPR